MWQLQCLHHCKLSKTVLSYIYQLVRPRYLYMQRKSMLARFCSLNRSNTNVVLRLGSRLRAIILLPTALENGLLGVWAQEPLKLGAIFNWRV